ncbi:MAG: hypothetical protein P4L66_04485 [Acetobacteraceae bacterium]|nr:hypothetical protein [Acetobacteraceae bacterium]
MTDFPPPLSREESLALGKRRRGRNIAMLIALVSVSALFYAISMVKMHAHIGGAG